MVGFEKAPVDTPSFLGTDKSIETVIKIWEQPSNNIFKNNVSVYVQTKENHTPFNIYMYTRNEIPIDLTGFVGATVFRTFIEIRKELRKRAKLERLLEEKLNKSDGPKRKKRQSR